MLPVCGVLEISAGRETRPVSRIEASSNEGNPSTVEVLPDEVVRCTKLTALA